MMPSEYSVQQERVSQFESSVLTSFNMSNSDLSEN